MINPVVLPAITLALLLSACGQMNQRSKVAKKTIEQTSVVEINTLAFDLGSYDLEPIYDAYTQVAGAAVASFTVARGGIDLATQPIEPMVMGTEPYAFFKGFAVDELSDTQLTLVEAICGSTYLSFDEAPTKSEATQEADTVTQSLYVHWRSHFGHQLTSDLGKLLLAHSGEILCGLRVWPIVGDETGNAEMVVFDPAPVEKHGGHYYAGTKDLNGSYDEVVMLLSTYRVGEEPEGFTAAPLGIDAGSKHPGDAATLAINARDWLPVVNDSSSPCVLRLTDAYDAEDDSASYTVAIEEKESGRLFLAVTPQAPVGETLLETCKSLDVEIAEMGNRVSVLVGCQQVSEVVNAGKKSCDLALSVAPADDPLSQVSVRLSLGFLFSTVDLTDAVGATSIFPEVADNPLRNAQVTLTGFRDTQEAALTRAFDVWLETSRHSYDRFFVNQIQEIRFDSATSGALCDTAGAYAFFDDDKFFWCPNGAMLDQHLTPDVSPTAAVYRAITALHETMHTHSRDHDFADSDLASCTEAGGTAYSAIVAVDLVACAQDYCFGLKDSAKEQFLSEVNYSLKDDDRRFSGMCAEWAETLGVQY